MKHPRPSIGRAARPPAFLVLLAVLLLAVQVAPAAAVDEGYRLGPHDRLRIKIVEWRPGAGQAVEWEALSDFYSVNASGRLSMPMLGEFLAGGKTTAALADAIGAEMQKRVGMPIRPEVSVEIDTYRPFYILGSVTKPSDYAFRPGITPLQAVGIAGGFYRPTDAGLLRIERDRITAQGLIEQNKLELLRGLVREARLQGETANRVEVKLAPDLAGRDLGSLVADEEAIARSRVDAFNAQMRSSESLKALLDEQIKTLDAKIASQAKQVDISRRELQSYSALTSQGLAITSRQFSLERTVAEAEGRKIDYEMAALTARQDRRKAEQAQMTLQSERQTKLAAELGDTRAGIEQARAKVAAQEGLVREATVTAPALVLARDQASEKRKPIFVLTRRDPATETASTTVVTEATTLEPGDVLRVEVPLPQAGEVEERTVRASDRRSSAE